MSPVEPTLPFTAQDIVAIRQDLVESHPASDRTVREIDAPCVDSAMQAALQGAFYTAIDGHLDHIHIASFLLYYVAKRHCFTDGNKRVAWAVAVDYFLQQGLMIVADQQDAAKLVEDVACDLLSKEDIIRWFGADNRLQEVGVV